MKIFINPKSKSIRIKGDVEIVDGEGRTIQKLSNPKLCGCGKAETYICDGSHKKDNNARQDN